MRVFNTIIGHGSAGRLRLATVIGAILGAGLLVAAAAVGGVISDSSSQADGFEISVTAPHVVIVKSKHVLYLFDGDRLVRSYPIDLGAAPVGTKRRQGDGRTPEGSFRIVTKNAMSPYHRFMGIDYPDLAAIEWGHACGLISSGEAASVRRALAAGLRPDWDTALGGGIGVHGHRIGRNWTGGCIALSNQPIEELFAVLRIGDLIEILP